MVVTQFIVHNMAVMQAATSQQWFCLDLIRLNFYIFVYIRNELVVLNITILSEINWLVSLCFFLSFSNSMRIAHRVHRLIRQIFDSKFHVFRSGNRILIENAAQKTAIRYFQRMFAAQMGLNQWSEWIAELFIYFMFREMRYVCCTLHIALSLSLNNSFWRLETLIGDQKGRVFGVSNHKKCASASSWFAYALDSQPPIHLAFHSIFIQSYERLPRRNTKISKTNSEMHNIDHIETLPFKMAELLLMIRVQSHTCMHAVCLCLVLFLFLLCSITGPMFVRSQLHQILHGKGTEGESECVPSNHQTNLYLANIDTDCKRIKALLHHQC